MVGGGGRNDVPVVSVLVNRQLHIFCYFVTIHC